MGGAVVSWRQAAVHTLRPQLIQLRARHFARLNFHKKTDPKQIETALLRLEQPHVCIDGPSHEILRGEPFQWYTICTRV